MNNPIIEFSQELEAGKKLCLLPVARVLLEEPMQLAADLIAYPPNYLSPDDFRIVSWPKYEFEELSRRYTSTPPDGTQIVQVSGWDLHWFKSAATGIDKPDFFQSALVAIPLEVPWDDFLSPASHETHLDILRSAFESAEDTFDLVRFQYCSPILPETLPGKVGFLEQNRFSCGLFYSLDDHESYIVAGEVIRHQLLSGIGLDMSSVNFCPIVEDGELGHIARNGLRMLTSALEANSETSKFVQLMTLLEYLADPTEYRKMTDVKKEIGRHVAQSRNSYDMIMNDFKLLTSDGRNTESNKGIRHNIVHLGKRFEELMPFEQRQDVFKRLWQYVGVPLQYMINHSSEDWETILEVREAAGRHLGLN